MGPATSGRILAMKGAKPGFARLLLGSSARLKYTSVGDTINTAARLESHDKEAFAAEPGEDFRILIGDDTFKRVEGTFSIESIGQQTLRGKEKAIGIYRVRHADPEPSKP